MKQYHVFVTGFVQGVGYRVYTVKRSRELGVTGWVRNLTDGRVEALLQGEEEVLRRLIRRLRKGPYFSQVEDIIIEQEEITEEFTDMKKLPTA